ncbi:MAG: hypothetical protein WDZ51_03475 [Pirellulaceae bacterium]
MKMLYAVLGLKNGTLPAGTFCIATNPDDVVAKSIGPLGGESGKITHIIPVCEASVGALTRNGLLGACSESDQIEFLASTVLAIATVLSDQNQALKSSLQGLMGTLGEKLGLRHFNFVVVVGDTGETQRHETLAASLELAQNAALEFAVAEYGESAQVTSIQEITNR